MKLVRIGDVCKLMTGGTPDTKVERFWDGPHAWITPAEMGNLNSPYLGISRRTLTDEGLRNSSAQLLPKQSVIMSSRAPIGHLIINQIPMASNQGCKGLIPFSNLNYKYLYYFLYANKEYLNALGSGTTFAEISGSKLKTVEIPLPSLEKQREIVEKLDKTFAEIDLLEGNLDSIESLINECDVSILGRTLNSNIGELGGYRISTLGDATNLISRGISPTYLDSASTVVLNQRCIRDGRVDLNFSRRHDEKAKRVQEPKLLQDGDGLINSTGVGTLGRTALFDHPGTGEFTVDSHVTIVRPKSDTLDSGYFGLVLRALENVFVSLSTGTSGQTELPREAIKETVITFPDDLDEQKDFFKYYSSLNSTVGEFRKMLLNKRVLSETLRVSLLSSAFTGVEEVA